MSDPSTPQPNGKPRIALALSGGGFRASLFHLGVMKRLAEFGWLPRVDVLSTVSGGSVIGAFAALRWPEWLRQGGDAAAFDKIVIAPFLELIEGRNMILEWLARAPEWPFRKLVDRQFTRSQAIAEVMDNWFFGGASCDALPEHPLLVLNATSLQSIRSWRFTRLGLGDSRIGYSGWMGASLPLSLAVCASASFPPVFPPVRIRRSGYAFSGPVYGEPALRDFEFASLTDGGVYDNSGMEVLLKNTRLPGGETLEEAEFVVVSDGGGPTEYSFRTNGIPTLTEGLLLYRADQIAREQVSALRTRWFLDQVVSGKRWGTLVSLRSAPARIPQKDFAEYCRAVPQQLQVPENLLPDVRGIRTSFDRFSAVESTALMYHAYLMTDCFLWCYRGNFPAAYRVPEHPSPTWKIEFTPELASKWHAGLRTSSRTLRIR